MSRRMLPKHIRAVTKQIKATAAFDPEAAACAEHDALVATLKSIAYDDRNGVDECVRLARAALSITRLKFQRG